jgi:hypothetical protein
MKVTIFVVLSTFGLLTSGRTLMPSNSRRALLDGGEVDRLNDDDLTLIMNKSASAQQAGKQY